MARVAVVALAVLALSSCGRSGDRQAVRSVAEQFYADVQHHDGARACERLSPDTRKSLEQEESDPCDRAVDHLDLNGGPVSSVHVYSTNAVVEFAGGDTVFLQDSPQGWEISAAGCRPQAHNEPAECEVQA